MRARTVARLSIAPVKAMALRRPDEIALERWGARGNRLFYLVDEAGRLFDGSRHGPLAAIAAVWDPEGETLSLTFPGDSVVEGRVRSGDETIETVFWGRPVVGRPVVGPWSEAVGRYVGRPLRLMRCERPGDANDEHPVSLVSTASLGELARRSGVPEVDARRFRMLIEVDGCEPHEEDRWIGRGVRIGEAVLRIVEPDPRCVVTTQNPDTGARDFDTLSAIAAYRSKRDGKKIDFGVYGAVERPGPIRLGDPVEPLDDELRGGGPT